MSKKILSDMEISSMCMELSLLLHAGVGVADGLALLSDETEGRGKALLASMAKDADQGQSLAAVMRGAERFPVYAVGLVDVGEKSGRLEEALQALARYYDDRDRLDRQIRASLTYPAVLLLLMLVVIVVLLVRVLPVFEEVYASLGGRLTGVAGGLLALGNALDAAMPVLCVLLAAVVAFFAAFAASQGFRTKVLSIWRKYRGDKGVSRKMADARFAQAMAMGLRSGLPVEESIELSASLSGDSPGTLKRCEDCKERLDRGEALAQAMRDSGVLPAAACRLLALGMRSGTGDSVMEEIARRLSRESEEALEAKVARIEPALVLVTSVLVGAILLSVMLPLMNIMTAIG